MSEYPRAVAIGFALVDEKIARQPNGLPHDGGTDLDAYLLNKRISQPCAGGSVANTLAAYANYSGNEARVHYTVGDDPRGELYRRSSAKLLGKPHIVKDGQTGFCILEIGEHGEIHDELNQYGVALDINIQTEEYATGADLLIANVNTLRHPTILDRAEKLLANLNKKNGVFAFRLSGAHALLSSQAEAHTVLDNLPRIPDIAFLNDTELENLITAPNVEAGLSQLLPDTRTIVLSRGAASIFIRHEGEISELATRQVQEVRDVTGAGDSLMGVALAELANKDFNEWHFTDIERAIRIGSYAAGTIITTMDSRLSSAELTSVRERNRVTA